MSPEPSPTTWNSGDSGVAWRDALGRLPARLPWLGGGKGVSRKFRRELSLGLGRMQGLIAETNDDVQRLCQQEQEFFLAAQAMTEQGSRLVELVSGQSVTETTRRLECLVEEVRSRFNTLQAGFAQHLKILASVRQDVDTASRPLAGYQKMVMGLRVLGISTRIESARLEGADEGFQLLAQEVSRLSDTIKAQTEGMASQMGSLGAQLSHALGSMSGLSESLSGGVGNLLAVIGQSLEELRQWRCRSELAATKMAATTHQVHTDVAEVVSSMQFHDITSQRLEHVLETLYRLLEGRAETSPIEICQLQGTLLGHAEKELVQAADTIQGSLRGIGESVRQVAQEAALLTRGNDGREVSFLERLEADLSDIMAMANQTEQALSDLRQLVESVVGTLEQVGSSLRSIDNISYSIKFVALNAAIKSARLGGKGAALESLAQAIQQLSSQAQTATQNLAGVLGHLSESAESLRQAMRAASGPGGQIVEEVESVLESIRADNQACNQLLRELEHTGHDLAARIEKGAGGIQFHLGIRQGISEVKDCLQRFVDPTGRKEIKPGSKDRSTLVSDNYTMASERQIHQAWAQGGAGLPPSPPAKAPRPSPATTGEPEASARDDQELGDNVELF